MVQIDSHYFGRLVVAPWNIVMYNVFSSHGPDLYGTEPWTFYIVNGILNFNIIFVAALVSLPLYVSLIITIVVLLHVFHYLSTSLLLKFLFAFEQFWVI